MEKHFKIGKLVSAFGLKGEMILQHHLGKKTSLKGLEVMLVEERKGAFLPYFVAATRIKSDKEIYISLDGVLSRESAARLVGREVWINDSDFKKFASHSAPISFLGYHLIHENQDLGEIVEVIEQPHQVICRVVINQKDALIPIHEKTLEKIDSKKKKLYVTLPDGLLDLYL